MHAPDERLAKLQRLREAGVDPYPAGTSLPDRTTVAAVLAAHDPDAEPRVEVTLAGRVASLRDHGNSLFLDLKDGTGRLQAYLQKQALGPERFALLKETLDLGDFVALRGGFGRTRKGEPTIFVAALELLTKSLAVPPSEYYGLEDAEKRQRQRYVDLLANPEVAERFRERSAIVATLRRFLEARDFMEVETPVLHAIAGGAAARPFVTHHNTLDMELVLRIAPELHLKRLLVGGYEKVFEIGRNFRNEGLSPRHNPEFTMLEAYWAYARADDWMGAVEDLLGALLPEHGVHVLDGEPLGPDRIAWGGRAIDCGRPFARARYGDLVAEHAGADVFDEASVRAAAARQRLPLEGRSHVQLVDDLFGACVEDHLVDPTFVTDFPLALCPLAKARPDDPRVGERFECFVAGLEVANGFSELNDPLDQEARFEAQVAQRDPELPGEVDHDYVNALAHGMPPAAGIGIGVDRLVMLLTGCASIRDVILFPLLRRVVEAELGGKAGPAAPRVEGEASPGPAQAPPAAGES